MSHIARDLEASRRTKVPARQALSAAAVHMMAAVECLEQAGSSLGERALCAGYAPVISESDELADEVRDFINRTRDTHQELLRLEGKEAVGQLRAK